MGLRYFCVPFSCVRRNLESLEMSPCACFSCWYTTLRWGLLGASTLSLLCMGRVLVDIGLPSLCFESCVTEKSYWYASIWFLFGKTKLEVVEWSVTFQSTPFAMWAEGPPAGSSWHAQCVSRKWATDSNIFAGEDGSQILNNCPFLFMLCKLPSKCFYKVLETFFGESKNFMNSQIEQLLFS